MKGRYKSWMISETGDARKSPSQRDLREITTKNEQPFQQDLSVGWQEF